MTRAWPLGLGVLTAVLAVTMLANPASAALQDITFQLECPAEAKTIQPASVPKSWDCTAVLTYKSAGTGMSDPLQPAIIGLEFPEAEPWMRPVASPPTVLTLGPQDGEEVVEAPVRITVGLTPDAPAFESTNLWIRAYVIQHPREEGELSMFHTVVGTNVTVTPGYYNEYTVRVNTERGEAQPQQPLRYQIQIDNFSNGATRFDFSVPTELPPGWVALTPEPVIVGGALGANASEGNATEDVNATSLTSPRVSVPFEVQTPYRNGYVDERRPIQLAVDSAFAADPTLQGTSSVVTMIGQVRGVYLPGPGAGLMALALVGAALVLSRARREL